jgi:hypothetical protein
MNKKSTSERTVNTVFAILLFGSLLLFAGIPAVNQANTISQATSSSVK